MVAGLQSAFPAVLPVIPPAQQLLLQELTRLTAILAQVPQHCAYTKTPDPTNRAWHIAQCLKKLDRLFLRMQEELGIQISPPSIVELSNIASMPKLALCVHLSHGYHLAAAREFAAIRQSIDLWAGAVAERSQFKQVFNQELARIEAFIYTNRPNSLFYVSQQQQSATTEVSIGTTPSPQSSVR